MATRKYVYHVVYTFGYPSGGNGNGTVEITTRLPLLSTKRIREVKDLIVRENVHPYKGTPEIVVTQMILLRVDGALERRARNRRTA